MKRVLITGANIGLGKELARQLAESGIEQIYLGCRDLNKANKAKAELELLTNRRVFKVLQMDLTDIHSVRRAVDELEEPVDGLAMNAGGTGGADFLKHNSQGVTTTFAMNVLGHVVLTEALLAAKKLTGTAVFAGTEVIRGVPEMGVKQYKLHDSSVNEFIAIANGSMFSGQTDPMMAYGLVKYMGVLWMASISRKYPEIRFVSMSPGGTTGTNGLNSLPSLKKFVFSVMMKLMTKIGRMHTVDVGAKRFVDALYDEKYESGHFYASAKGVVGPVIDQSRLFEDLDNQTIQNNATQAIRQFL